RVERIGVHDNFFDLGGHSLLAIRALSRIRDLFEVNLSPRMFFANPTIAGLAGTLAGAKEIEGISTRIRRQARTGPMPLSFAQERIWFLEQLTVGSPAYNVVDVIRFEGECDAERMRRSIQALVKRHESLRTVFESGDGQPTQVVLPELNIALRELDLRAFPD